MYAQHLDSVARQINPSRAQSRSIRRRLSETDTLPPCSDPTAQTCTITVQEFVVDRWARRHDVDVFLFPSQIKSGSLLWQVDDVLSGYPIDPQAIYPSLMYFYFTDDYGKRRRARWPVKPEQQITVVFKAGAR